MGRRERSTRGPTGIGTLADGSPVDRTFLTARSIEFDALVVLAVPAPAADAVPDLDGKAGTPSPPGREGLDPRLILLLQEVYRQAKAIVLVGTGRSVIAGAGLPAEAPGVVEAEPAGAVEAAVGLLGTHRVWARPAPR